MTMTFIAHTSNRVSRHLVMEFLTWLLLRHKDPCIMQVESHNYHVTGLCLMVYSLVNPWPSLFSFLSLPSSHLPLLPPQLESRLLDRPSRHTGSMLEVEFAEAMDCLLPLLPDQLCRRLFMQSLSQLREEEGQSHRETVPTKRLACIQLMYQLYIARLFVGIQYIVEGSMDSGGLVPRLD